MATAQFFDRYSSTLASGYTSGGGSLSVTSASGLPAAGDFWVKVAAEGANTEEVFKVTARSGTTLTVTGAQAGTSASNHASGAVITGFVLTKDALDQFRYDMLGYQATEPPSTGWTSLNLGGVTLDTTIPGSRRLYSPSDSGLNWRGEYRTAPSTPYTVTAILDVSGMPWINFAHTGIMFRESSTGKMHGICQLHNNGPYRYVRRMTDASTHSADDDTLTWPSGHLSRVVFRIEDGGTNIVFKYGTHVDQLTTLRTLSRTVFMAGGPDQIGWFISGFNAVWESTSRLISWV